mmetsp:Transcript_36154/g.83045  ORF Transcript_36154/g.83045 Transcript_36154/m.83045 type:complete len:1309 (-) Transcript_36154:126-4052(-)
MRRGQKSQHSGRVSVAPRAQSRNSTRKSLVQPVEHQLCCLAWSLSPQAQATITEMQLQELHREIDSCSQMIGAKAVEWHAGHGVLVCTDDPQAMASAADSAVRLGQQLCHWAASEEPPIGLRVGAHVDMMRKVKFADGQCKYVGAALKMAKQLAETCQHDACVRFMNVTRFALRRFDTLPFALAPGGDSYLLDVALLDKAATQDALAHHEEQHVQQLGSTYSKVNLASNVPLDTPPATPRGRGRPTVEGRELSMDKFTQLLEKCGVDVNEYGVGSAKTLEELYTEIAISKKSQLVEENGRLERRMELVRINLCVKDPEHKGKERMLRIATEMLEDGRMRTRNQKLAQVVKDGCPWTEAMRECFEKKLGIDKEVQDTVFALDMSWLKTERMDSLSYPGIETTYLTHEVRVHVINAQHPDLKGIGLPLLQNFTTADGALKYTWTWTPIGEKSTYEDILTALLQEHHIDISKFPAGAFGDLLEEVYNKKMSMLMLRDGELQRHLDIVKVWLCADIHGMEHCLVIRTKVQDNVRHAESEQRPISMRMATHQSWEEAVGKALNQRLRIDEAFQAESVVIDHGTYKVREEVEMSSSFPGLTTVYSIHEVQVRLKPGLVYPALGMPDGHDFALTRPESRGKSFVTTYFCWKTRKELFDEQTQRIQLEILACRRNSRPVSSVDMLHLAREGTATDAVPDDKRRLDVPHEMVPSKVEPDDSIPLCHLLMKDKKCNMERAWNAAKCIRDRDYTLKKFHDDCVASFPELMLYLYDADEKTSSGRTGDDEYQRTMGALFAVYWLMRLDIDGTTSFSFGVGEDWKPLGANSKKPVRLDKEMKQRGSFCTQMQWGLCQELLVDAGMLSAGANRGHNEERTLAILVLTAIHDIMKVAALCPKVGPDDEQWCGYKTGEVINDHDAALGYLLERCPEALPSFYQLPERQRESIKFTQGKMDYNMGWLVQAEAPPGALFRTFKNIIKSGHAAEDDVAFYFVHWLTDLAGAEPYPLEGCTKFVLKFPQKVLLSFLYSFPVVKELHEKSETQVLEDYLVWRWQKHDPLLGEAPVGRGAIAAMRLVVMAQSAEALHLLNSFQELPLADQEVLNDELARTGCKDQIFRSELVDRLDPCPAILVYYAPALIQKNVATDPLGALLVLVEVFRQARKLWPLDSDGEASVIVRIDALKELTTNAMHSLNPGEAWILQKTSSKDGQVKRTALVEADGKPVDIDWSTNRMMSLAMHHATDSQATPVNLWGGSSQQDALSLHDKTAELDMADIAGEGYASGAPAEDLEAIPHIQHFTQSHGVCCGTWCVPQISDRPV